MKKPLVFLFIISLFPVLHAGTAFPDPDRYPIMGDYLGSITELPEKGVWKDNPFLSAQVINIDQTQYRVRLLPELDQRCPAYLDEVLDGSHQRLVKKGKTWQFKIENGVIDGRVLDNDEWVPFRLERTARISPTMGKPAPDGAVVLMDGSSLDPWVHAKGEPCTWQLIGDGAMEIVPVKVNPKALGTVFSKETFKDCRMHIEFRYPVEEGRRGQDRGNSGVFIMGYEVQVLNSYGLEGYWNECGALYKVMAPKVNAAAPPLQWQTYDIDFRAPRFDASGKKVQHARMTVRHNGIIIHENQEIPYHTTHRQTLRDLPEPRQAMPISLQDHSNPIQFRNIWVLPLDEDPS